jgi:hypothetical protein
VSDVLALASTIAPKKRTPLRIYVRMNFRLRSTSPIVFRTALMRLSSVESDTIRPPQTEAQVVLADDAIAVLDQVKQQVEDLWF